MRTVTKEEVEFLYNKFVKKDPSYYQRFENLMDKYAPNEAQRYSRMDPPRAASIWDYKEWITKYKLRTGNSLLVTCNDPEIVYLSYRQVTYAPFPPHDLHTLNLEKKDHDFVVFNQTLEHLYNPYLAMMRIRDHMKVGGYVFTSVPTINIPHMMPHHFWGITPIGLCVLMASVGFEVCECGYWGNKKYIDYIFTHNNWPNYADVLTDGVFTSDDVSQAQTWILARKLAV